MCAELGTSVVLLAAKHACLAGSAGGKLSSGLVDDEWTAFI